VRRTLSRCAGRDRGGRDARSVTAVTQRVPSGDAAQGAPVTQTEYRRTTPSLVQRVTLFFLRGRAAEVEARTREWIVTCPSCGLERDLWDLGGVRYKFRRRGRPEGVRIRCPRCNERGAHPLEHSAG
jgi:hypothetical protein